MVRKEACPHCRGDKWVDIKRSDGRPKTIKCPHCSGEGYRVRVTLKPQ